MINIIDAFAEHDQVTLRELNGRGVSARPISQARSYTAHAASNTTTRSSPPSNATTTGTATAGDL
ncbi:hypothetical protein AB0M43_35830 [Longispora sp. NPDC051575]|uniref:hypothetical protein n=1 Tax=Longispora sp. NPDC051575 TaxID=3154943 RepID=UPI0034482EFE